MYIQINRLTPVLKLILIFTIVCFVVDVFTSGQYFLRLFELNTFGVKTHWQVWRLATYVFSHDINGIGHIFFNMFSFMDVWFICR